MNYAALKAELQADSQTLGYAALISAGKDQDLANLLNLANRAGRKPTDPAKLKSSMFESGVLRKVLDAADTHATTTVKYTARALVSYIDDRRMTSVDLDNAAVVAMIDTLKNATPAVITAAEKTTLLAIGDAQLSRAEQVLGLSKSVTATDIAIALRNT